MKGGGKYVEASQRFIEKAELVPLFCFAKIEICRELMYNGGGTNGYYC